MRCVHRERDVDNRTLGVEPAIFGAHPSRSGACGSNDTLGARAVARLRRSFRVHEPAYARSLGPAKLWRNNRFFVHSSNSKGGQVSLGTAACVCERRLNLHCGPARPAGRDSF